VAKSLCVFVCVVELEGSVFDLAEQSHDAGSSRLSASRAGAGRDFAWPIVTNHQIPPRRQYNRDEDVLVMVVMTSLPRSFSPTGEHNLEAELKAQ